MGTEGEADVRIFGVTVVDPVRITEFEPPHRFAISHEGSFKGRGLITLESGADPDDHDRSMGGATRPASPPPPRCAGPEPDPRSISQADLVRLKELVETGSTAT